MKALHLSIAFSLILQISMSWAQPILIFNPPIQEIKRLPAKKINNKIDKEIIFFIPTGYTLLDAENGDINRDGLIDKIIILQLIKEGNASEEKRPLIILLRKKNGKLAEAARNDNIVLSYDMGGIHGDPYHGLTIKKGFFTVEHFGGSAWRWNYTSTFYFSKKIQQWLLYKTGNEWWHITKPKKYETENSTQKNFGMVKFNSYINKLRVQ